MKCPSCGLEIHQERKICDCGHDLRTKKIKQREINKTRNLEEEELRCRECGSNQLTTNKQGYGWKKGLGVAVCTVGVGALAGFINSNKVWITCLKCGHRWKAGKS